MQSQSEALKVAWLLVQCYALARRRDPPPEARQRRQHGTKPWVVAERGFWLWRFQLEVPGVLEPPCRFLSAALLPRLSDFFWAAACLEAAESPSYCSCHGVCFFFERNFVLGLLTHPGSTRLFQPTNIRDLLNGWTWKKIFAVSKY